MRIIELKTINIIEQENPELRNILTTLVDEETSLAKYINLDWQDRIMIEINDSFREDCSKYIKSSIDKFEEDELLKLVDDLTKEDFEILDDMYKSILTVPIDEEYDIIYSVFD